MSRRRRQEGGPDGVVVVDKAAGWTSHDVVAKARGLLGTRRVGHAGTLDPDATGVLVLGVGRATRLLRFLGDLVKVYEAEIVLGVETDTLDASGEVMARHDISAVTGEQVRAAAAALTGSILQVPPMVSAVQIDGRRLHELAREGIEVEREARAVTVYRFDVSPDAEDPARWHAHVECSSGTYVRTLAADLGRAVGAGAHLGSLQRTAVGSFGLDEAVPVEALAPEAVSPPAAALRDHPSVKVNDAVAGDVRHGKVLPLEMIAPPGAAALPGAAPAAEAATPPGADASPEAAPPAAWAVLDGEGALLAVYEPHGETTAKPAVVIAPAAT